MKNTKVDTSKKKCGGGLNQWKRKMRSRGEVNVKQGAA